MQSIFVRKNSGTDCKSLDRAFSAEMFLFVRSTPAKIPETPTVTNVMESIMDPVTLRYVERIFAVAIGGLSILIGGEKPSMPLKTIFI